MHTRAHSSTTARREKGAREKRTPLLRASIAGAGDSRRTRGPPGRPLSHPRPPPAELLTHRRPSSPELGVGGEEEDGRFAAPFLCHGRRGPQRVPFPLPARGLTRHSRGLARGGGCRRAIGRAEEEQLRPSARPWLRQNAGLGAPPRPPGKAASISSSTSRRRAQEMEKLRLRGGIGRGRRAPLPRPPRPTLPRMEPGCRRGRERRGARGGALGRPPCRS